MIFVDLLGGAASRYIPEYYIFIPYMLGEAATVTAIYLNMIFVYLFGGAASRYSIYLNMIFVYLLGGAASRYICVLVVRWQGCSRNIRHLEQSLNPT